MIVVALFANIDTVHDHITTRRLVRCAVDGVMPGIRDRMNTTPAGKRGLRNLLGSGGIGVCVVATILRHRKECTSTTASGQF
jgi:hypothetical protein